jgi:hypothetical protein
MKIAQSLCNIDEIQIAIVGSQDSFEVLVSQAVDEVLSKLGDSCKTAIYQALERQYKISRLEIPTKIKEFSMALDQIFGSGSRLLEIEIMKRLHSKVPNCEQASNKKDLSFDGYITLLSSAVC